MVRSLPIGTTESDPALFRLPVAFRVVRIVLNTSSVRRSLSILAIAWLGLAGCSSTDDTASGDAAGRPSVVVSTTVWGDVVDRAFGDLVDVTVLLPDNADPHHFQPSAQQAAQLEDADLIVINGAGLEAGLSGSIESAQSAGVEVFEVADHVDTRPIDTQQSVEDDDHESDDGDDHDGNIDPHIWFDPTLVSQAVAALAQQLESQGVAGAASQAAPYLGELDQLDTDIVEQVAAIPLEQRLLVTNHDSFEYYAARYDFTVVATVVGSITTDAEPSIADLEEVVTTIEENDVQAVFVESNESAKLADALVAETGRDIAVVDLLTESLGSTGSYTEMMRTDTDRIVEALTVAQG